MSDLSPPDAPTMHAAARARSGAGTTRADSAEFGFWDLVDIVNPLQHIPVVSSVYRRITGDEIRPDMQILGDTLYGGPIGLVAGVANAVVEQISGNTVGDHLVAMLSGDGVEETPAVIADAAAPGTADEPVVAIASAPAPDTGGDATATAPDGDSPALLLAAAPRTAVLPHGFPLTPPSRAVARGLPLTRPAAPPAAPPAAAAPRGTLTIATDLDAKLRRLAVEAGAAASPAAADRPEPARGTEMQASADAAPAPVHPQVVPAADVPAAMMRALELYQRSGTGTTAIPAAVPTLDTQS